MYIFLKHLSYHSMVFLTFLFFTFSIFSCIPSDIKGTTDTQFFDLKGFLDNQISALEKKQKKGSLVIKKTILQGQENQQTLKKIDWKDEFAFFYAADINTPQLRDMYEVEKTPQKWTFKTEEEKMIVKEMQIMFDGNTNSTSFENVKEILIIQKDKNNLYENNRTLIIKVKKGVLESYFIKGSEEVILNERQEFLVEGVVRE